MLGDDAETDAETTATVLRSEMVDDRRDSGDDDGKRWLKISGEQVS